MDDMIDELFDHIFKYWGEGAWNTESREPIMLIIKKYIENKDKKQTESAPHKLCLCHDWSLKNRFHKQNINGIL